MKPPKPPEAIPGTLKTMTTQKDLGGAVIQSLTENSDKWKFDEYRARCGAFVMWTANRPYDDLRLGEMAQGPRIGTWRQRRKIRKLMDSIIADRALRSLLDQTEALGRIALLVRDR